MQPISTNFTCTTLVLMIFFDSLRIIVILANYFWSHLYFNPIFVVFSSFSGNIKMKRLSQGFPYRGKIYFYIYIKMPHHEKKHLSSVYRLTNNDDLVLNWLLYNWCYGYIALIPFLPQSVYQNNRCLQLIAYATSTTCYFL